MSSRFRPFPPLLACVTPCRSGRPGSTPAGCRSGRPGSTPAGGATRSVGAVAPTAVAAEPWEGGAAPRAGAAAPRAAGAARTAAAAPRSGEPAPGAAGVAPGAGEPAPTGGAPLREREATARPVAGEVPEGDQASCASGLGGGPSALRPTVDRAGVTGQPQTPCGAGSPAGTMSG